MIDTAVIRARHLDPEATKGRTMYEGHILVDLALALDEIVQLRLEQARAHGRLCAEAERVLAKVEELRGLKMPDHAQPLAQFIGQAQILNRLIKAHASPP